MVIRMISGGFGLSYTDANGVPRFALKTPSSGWFECPDDQAEALVKAGRAIAKRPASAQPAPQEAAEEAETIEEDGPDLSVSDVVLPEVPEKPVKSRRSRRKKE